MDPVTKEDRKYPISSQYGRPISGESLRPMKGGLVGVYKGQISENLVRCDGPSRGDSQAEEAAKQQGGGQFRALCPHRRTLARALCPCRRTTQGAQPQPDLVSRAIKSQQGLGRVRGRL
jgi:hypothetical protein